MTDLEKLQQLQRRWLRKTGDPMPDAIAGLPIDRVRRAVQLTEAGQTVFVPGAPVTARRTESGGGDGGDGGSMREWDGDNFH